jgi:hypothetical protein
MKGNRFGVIRRQITRQRLLEYLSELELERVLAEAALKQGDEETRIFCRRRSIGSRGIYFPYF